MDRKNVCANCRHWLHEKDATGQCRRHPPVVVYMPVGRNHVYKSEFPHTAPTDWCGEWASLPLSQVKAKAANW
jgi:hypothetical protein